MNSVNKKSAKAKYRSTPRPMGIFAIRNSSNGKVFVASSVDLPGSFNRHRFQLNAGLHQSKSLQKDWNDIGEAGFEFEVLEELPPRSEPGYDHSADLEVLEDIWLEKLEPYGEKGYNEKKKTREERLRMIAENRRNS